MSEKLINRIVATVGRRGFLGTISAASAAFVLGLFKIQGASASGVPCGPGTFPVGPCCLFFDPRTCTYGDCGCEWVWKHVASGFGSLSSDSVTDPSGGRQPEHEDRISPKIIFDLERCRLYSCKECYAAPGTSGTDCNCTGPAKCSKATYITIPC